MEGLLQGCGKRLTTGCGLQRSALHLIKLHMGKLAVQLGGNGGVLDNVAEACPAVRQVGSEHKVCRSARKCIHVMKRVTTEQ